MWLCQRGCFSSRQASDSPTSEGWSSGPHESFLVATTLAQIPVIRILLSDIYISHSPLMFDSWDISTFAMQIMLLTVYLCVQCVSLPATLTVVSFVIIFMSHQGFWLLRALIIMLCESSPLLSWRWGGFTLVFPWWGLGTNVLHK